MIPSNPRRPQILSGAIVPTRPAPKLTASDETGNRLWHAWMKGRQETLDDMKTTLKHLGL